MKLIPKTAIAATTAATLALLGGAPATANTVDGEEEASTSSANTDVITHGDLYDDLVKEGLPSRNTTVEAVPATEFDLGEGVTVTLPKPNSKGYSPTLSGKINKKGEPVIYLNQNDQKRVKKIAGIGVGALAVFLKGTPLRKFFQVAALSTIASYFNNGKGICPSKKKTLRITGTAGGDAIKEIKCV